MDLDEFKDKLVRTYGDLIFRENTPIPRVNTVLIVLLKTNAYYTGSYKSFHFI